MLATTVTFHGCGCPTETSCIRHPHYQSLGLCKMAWLKSRQTGKPTFLLLPQVLHDYEGQHGPRHQGPQYPQYDAHHVVVTDQDHCPNVVNLPIDGDLGKERQWVGLDWLILFPRFKKTHSHIDTDMFFFCQLLTSFLNEVMVGMVTHYCQRLLSCFPVISPHM